MTSFIHQVGEFSHLSQFGVLVQQLMRYAMESCIPTGICAGATTRFMARSGPMRRHFLRGFVQKWGMSPVHKWRDGFEKLPLNIWEKSADKPKFFLGFPMFRQTHGCSATWILSSLGAGYGAQCSSRGVHETNAGEMACMMLT